MPDAVEKSVHDRFRVKKHVGEAVDRVHKQEHREFMGRMTIGSKAPNISSTTGRSIYRTSTGQPWRT